MKPESPDAREIVDGLEITVFGSWTEHLGREDDFRRGIPEPSEVRAALRYLEAAAEEAEFHVEEDFDSRSDLDSPFGRRLHADGGHDIKYYKKLILSVPVEKTAKALAKVREGLIRVLGADSVEIDFRYRGVRMKARGRVTPEVAVETVQKMMAAVDGAKDERKAKRKTK